MSHVYPPSPAEVPDDLLRPTVRYRLQVAVVLVSLLLFLALYLALVAASGWLTWRMIEAPLVGRGLYAIILKIGSIGAAGMLFVFLVKGLFKMQRDDRSDLMEIDPAKEPRFFEFLRRLVEETGAPMPKRVYLTSEVNAAVFYDSSVLSLFFPVRKNLLVGLGLVNALNLSELKAVLGHELGHFSQGTMRVGSYVYVANRIVCDIVLGRDRWDDLLREWRRQDLRIAIFGWVLSAIVWVVRKVLELLASSEELRFPKLRNMNEGEPLRAFLLQQPVVPSRPTEGSIDGAWVQLLLDQLAEIDDKLARLYFKSMGGLLALQEEIARRARALAV